MVCRFFSDHLSAIRSPNDCALVLWRRLERGLWISPVFGGAIGAGGRVSLGEIVGGRDFGQLCRPGQRFPRRSCLPGVFSRTVIHNSSGSAFPERGALLLSMGAEWQNSVPIKRSHAGFGGGGGAPRHAAVWSDFLCRPSSLAGLDGTNHSRRQVRGKSTDARSHLRGPDGGWSGGSSVALLDLHSAAPDCADSDSACQPVESAFQFFLRHELFCCSLRRHDSRPPLHLVAWRSCPPAQAAADQFLVCVHLRSGWNDAFAQISAEARF